MKSGVRKVTFLAPLLSPPPVKKSGRENWGVKSEVRRVKREKWGEKSGARIVGREKWGGKSGARKVG